MTEQPTGAGFLAPPEPTPEVQAMYDDDVDDMGFVMNASRLWGHLPATQRALMETWSGAAKAAGLSFRQRGVLVTATASAMGDSYCSLAWGHKLSEHSGADVAEGVLRGDDSLLDDQDRALAAWARAVARDPYGTTAADVQALRDVGYDEAQILAITVSVSMRIAFSTVNGALGAQPDRELDEQVAPPVRDAVGYGRPAWTGA